MNVWWLLGGFVVSLVSIVLCARLPVTGSVVPSFPVETIENRPWLRDRVNRRVRVGLRVETVAGQRRLPEAKWPVARPEDPGEAGGQADQGHR